MYQFKEYINYECFFRFDKKLIKDKHWAKLPLASKRIFPVIGVHCNASGIAFPSEQTIAILTGCAEKTVREGIKGLMGFPNFRKERWVTNRGHRANKYIITLPPREKGIAFFFYKAIITGGNWYRLIPSAQALYPVVQTFSFFEYFSDANWPNGEEPHYIDDYGDTSLFSDREYDLMNADIDVLVEYSGINRSSVYNAIHSLEENFLIGKAEPFDSLPTWKIFMIPPKRYEHEWLNENSLKR